MTNQEIKEKLQKINVYKTKLMIYLKNHCQDIFNAIFENTSFLDDNDKTSFAERVYCVKNDITSKVLCNVCHENAVKFNRDVGEYKKHCSIACANADKEVLEKKKQTSIKHFGVDNANNAKKARETRLAKNNGKWHADDFGKAVKETKLKNHGDASWNNLEKRRKTCIELYGVDHPMKNQSVVQRRKERFAKMHDGIDCVFKLPEVVERTKTGNRKKAWRCMNESALVAPCFSLEQLLEIEDLNQDDCLEFECKRCGTKFKSKWDNGCCKQCPSCYPELHGTSQMELEACNFLKDVNRNDSIKIFNRDKLNKHIIAPKELDIVIAFDNVPKIAIEFDGLYWHSEAAGAKQKQLLQKTLLCEEKGIQLIHLFENEWLAKKQIVESRLKNLLGVYDKVIYARSCQVKEIDFKASKEFQERTHIQGAANSSVNLGLLFNGQLVALMTFGKTRFSKQHEWELLRFSTELNCHVVGAAGKLLSCFEKEHAPKSLISYADRRWSQGKLYKALGFQLDHASAPDYWYLKPQNTSMLFNRVKFQKHKLKNLLESFNEQLSEVANMRENGYTRVFDCGNLVFVKRYEEQKL